MKKFRDNVLDVGGFYLSIGSSIHGGALVAVGKFVATICSSPHPHDAASVKIIVEEAGGKVTDLDGNEQRYDQPINGFVATNGYLHEEILKLMKD